MILRNSLQKPKSETDPTIFVQHLALFVFYSFLQRNNVCKEICSFMMVSNKQSAMEKEMSHGAKKKDKTKQSGDVENATCSKGLQGFY